MWGYEQKVLTYLVVSNGIKMMLHERNVDIEVVVPNGSIEIGGNL
jgi:hypothetical protein